MCSATVGKKKTQIKEAKGYQDEAKAITRDPSETRTCEIREGKKSIGIEENKGLNFWWYTDKKKKKYRSKRFLTHTLSSIPKE